MSASIRRPWRDAHPSIRCRATVRLRDGSTAQCGRAHDRRYSGNPHWRMFCAQHQEMHFTGKHVETWRD